MASHEGFLDYGSGRYKLVGRPGQDDYYFHAGEWLEVWRDRGWLAVSLGMRARVVNQWQAM